MFAYIVAIRCYNSLEAFINISWLIIPLIVVLIFNLVVYGVKFSSKASQFKPMMFVSFSVILGGLGFISAEEYFAGASVYHMLGMGFGMVILYCFFYARIDINKDFSLLDRLTKLMVVIGLLGSLLILVHYPFNIDLVIEKGGIFFIRWRNNLSTILMIAMPFAFFLASKKPYAILFGFIFYLGMLFSGSRGGMLFGAIELAMCLVIFFLYDRKRRLSYIIVCVCIGFSLLVFLPTFIQFFSNTFNRLLKVLNQFLIGGYENPETRVKHYARGIEDFLNQPIFGTGLGYMGNRDIFKNKPGSLCWYHCEPIQIAASFGVVLYFVIWGADAGFGAFTSGLVGFSSAENPLLTGEGNFFTRLLGNILIVAPNAVSLWALFFVAKKTFSKNILKTVVILKDIYYYV
jgi:hypothetical protein